MTDPLAPHAEAVRDHLAGARFNRGVDAGRWRLVEHSGPTVVVAVAAADRDEAPTEYGLRIDLTDYPHQAPTFEPWHLAEDRRLTANERPKGERAGQIFRHDWEQGRALYAAYDRVALKGHGNWTTAYPRSAWTPARDLTFALDHIWEVLNDDDYLGT
jgi:hypothetical protein